MITYIHYLPSPVGRLTLAGDGGSLTGLWMEGQKYYPVFHDSVSEKKDLPVFLQTEEWLACYFSGREPGFTPPLAPEGTPFQQSVWGILLCIPFGSTTTYGRIAEQMTAGGKKASPRSVGGAVGHNPISILIPCHRVMGAGNSLTGYAGGLERKETLLRLENPRVSFRIK